MNYNARDDENNSRALRDAEIDEGRNQEKHQVLMVNKTTSFKKRAKGKKGNFKKNGKQVVTPVKKPKAGSLKLSASTTKEMVTGSGTTPNIWRIRRMAK